MGAAGGPREALGLAPGGDGACSSRAAPVELKVDPPQEDGKQDGSVEAKGSKRQKHEDLGKVLADRTARQPAEDFRLREPRVRRRERRSRKRRRDDNSDSDSSTERSVFRLASLPEGSIGY